MYWIVVSRATDWANYHLPQLNTQYSRWWRRGREGPERGGLGRGDGPVLEGSVSWDELPIVVLTRPSIKYSFIDEKSRPQTIIHHFVYTYTPPCARSPSTLLLPIPPLNQSSSPTTLYIPKKAPGIIPEATISNINYNFSLPLFHLRSIHTARRILASDNRRRTYRNRLDDLGHILHVECFNLIIQTMIIFIYRFVIRCCVRLHSRC